MLPLRGLRPLWIIWLCHKTVYLWKINNYRVSNSSHVSDSTGPLADLSGFHSSYEVGRKQRKCQLSNARDSRKFLETSKRWIRRHYLDSVSYVLLNFLTLWLSENLAQILISPQAVFPIDMIFKENFPTITHKFGTAWLVYWYSRYCGRIIIIIRRSLFFPYSRLSSYLLLLFFCLILFFLFSCASVRETLVQEFLISCSHTEWYTLLFSFWYMRE